MSASTSPASAPAFESNARAIIDAARELHGHEVTPVLAPDGTTGTFVILPEGKIIRSLQAELEAWRDRPARVRGTATLQDEQSFISHVQRFADTESVCFCTPDRVKPTFTAVYDYHESAAKEREDGGALYRKPPAGPGASGTPRWLQHKATFAPRLADEWRAWMDRSGKPFTPVDFAEFLEERVVDVYNGLPSEKTAALIEAIEARLASSTQLVGLARNFAVNVDTQVRQAQTLQSGEISIQYAEAHRDGETGQPIRVPNAFLIAIPVFFAGPTYQLLVRLRYRLVQGKLSWTYHVHRPELILDHALQEMAARIADQTDLPLLLGAPEA